VPACAEYASLTHVTEVCTCICRTNHETSPTAIGGVPKSAATSASNDQTSSEVSEKPAETSAEASACESEGCCSRTKTATDVSGVSIAASASVSSGTDSCDPEIESTHVEPPADGATKTRVLPALAYGVE